jgi:hypothetical protein
MKSITFYLNNNQDDSLINLAGDSTINNIAITLLNEDELQEIVSNNHFFKCYNSNPDAIAHHYLINSNAIAKIVYKL